MAEYIKREAVVEAVKNIPMWGSDAAKMVESIPAEDVEAVVRCKNCGYGKPLHGAIVCCCHGKLIRMHPDGFCYYGKPKESFFCPPDKKQEVDKVNPAVAEK